VEVVRPGKSEATERVLLEPAYRLGIKPVTSLNAHFAAPKGHSLPRLLCAVRRGVALDQLPAGGVLPANHLASPEEVTERWRDTWRTLARLLFWFGIFCAFAAFRSCDCDTPWPTTVEPGDEPRLEPGREGPIVWAFKPDGCDHP
jgi:hypothetical protein